VPCVDSQLSKHSSFILCRSLHSAFAFNSRPTLHAPRHPSLHYLHTPRISSQARRRRAVTTSTNESRLCHLEFQTATTLLRLGNHPDTWTKSLFTRLGQQPCHPSNKATSSQRLSGRDCAQSRKTRERGSRLLSRFRRTIHRFYRIPIDWRKGSICSGPLQEQSLLARLKKARRARRSGPQSHGTGRARFVQWRIPQDILQCVRPVRYSRCHRGGRLWRGVVSIDSLDGYIARR
jgi:hypothetical protein